MTDFYYWTARADHKIKLRSATSTHDKGCSARPRLRCAELLDQPLLERTGFRPVDRGRRAHEPPRLGRVDDLRKGLEKPPRGQLFAEDVRRARPPPPAPPRPPP